MIFDVKVDDFPPPWEGGEFFCLRNHPTPYSMNSLFTAYSMNSLFTYPTRTTRTTSRTTRTTSRTNRTIHIRSPPKGGLLIGRVLMVRWEVALVVLEVVLVVLEVTGPQVPWGKFQIRLSLRPDLYSPDPPICIKLIPVNPL